MNSTWMDLTQARYRREVVEAVAEALTVAMRDGKMINTTLAVTRMLDGYRDAEKQLESTMDGSTTQHDLVMRGFRTLEDAKEFRRLLAHPDRFGILSLTDGPFLSGETFAFAVVERHASAALMGVAL